MRQHDCFEFIRHSELLWIARFRSPCAAILAAARLLRDHGAPGDYPGALHHYNPSQLYVGAVRRYAKLIARDRDAVHYLYCWAP